MKRFRNVTRWYEVSNMGEGILCVRASSPPKACDKVMRLCNIQGENDLHAIEAKRKVMPDRYF